MNEVQDVGQFPIRIRRGRSFRLKFQYKVDGAPADLTGLTGRMMIKTQANDAHPWPGCDLGTDQITVGPDGWVEALISSAVTAALPSMPMQGVYDLVLVGADGYVKPVLEGSVQLMNSVTEV